MAVSETKIKISLVDGLTSGLNNATQANERFNRSLGMTGQRIGSIPTTGVVGIGTIATQATQANTALETLNKTFARLAYATARYAIVYRGVSALSNAFSEIVGGGIEYAKSLEENKLGISGILTSMTNLNGKTLEWGQALQISDGILNRLQESALKTSASATELVEAFRAILGPGLAGGMTVQQIEDFVTVGVNAVKSMGLPSNQVVQELRDLVQGGIRPASSTVATSLGITDADIKKAKNSAEGLYNFLMERMKGLKIAALKRQDITRGLEEQIKEGLQRGIADGSLVWKSFYTNVLKDIADKVVTLDEKTGKMEINKEFLKDIHDISENFVNIANQSITIGKTLAPLVKTAVINPLASVGGYASNHLQYIAMYIGLKKMLPHLIDVMNILGNKRSEYNATTFTGKFIQGTSDKLHGRQAELERLTEEQNRLTDAITRTIEKTNEFIHTGNMLENCENSIYNLGKRWEEMGLNVKTAKRAVADAVHALAQGDYGYYQLLVQYAETEAKNNQERRIALQQQEELRERELNNIQKIIAQEERKANIVNSAYVQQKKLITDIQRQQASAVGYTRINTFLDDEKTAEFQKNMVNDLIKQLRKLKLEEKDVIGFTQTFIKSIKKLDENKGTLAFEQAIQSAQTYKKILADVAEQGASVSQAQIRVETYLGTLNNIGEAQEKVKSLIDYMRNLAMSEEDVYLFADKFITALSTIDTSSVQEVDRIYRQVAQSANEYMTSVHELNAQKQEQIEIDRRVTLEQTALSNAYRLAGEAGYQNVQWIINEEKRLIEQLKMRGVETANLEKITLGYLERVANARKKDEVAVDKQTEAIIRNTQAQINNNEAYKRGIVKLANFAQGVGNVAFAMGILTDVIGDQIDKEDEWHSQISTTLFDIGLFITSVSMLTEAFKGAYKYLEKIGKSDAFKWIARTGGTILGGIGLGGATVATAVGASLFKGYNSYDAYNNDEKGMAVSFSDMGINRINRKQKIAELKEHPEMFTVDEWNDVIYIKSDKNNAKQKREEAEQAEEKARLDRMYEERLQEDKQEEEWRNKQEADPSKLQLNTPKNDPTSELEKIKKQIEKAQTMKVDIGDFVSKIAQTDFSEGEQWVSDLVEDTTKQCAIWVSTLYKKAGIEGLYSVNGDELVNQFGSAYHANDGTYNVRAGDLINWQNHVGISLGDGRYMARNSQGGVHIGTMEEAKQFFGDVLGYGSIEEFTGGQKVEIEVSKEAKEQWEHVKKTVEEYRKMIELTEALNEETGEVTGKTSEYDKIMGKAKKKAKEIVDVIIKAKDYGLNTTSLETAYKKWIEAQEKHAQEAQKKYDLNKTFDTYKENMNTYRVEMDRINIMHDINGIEMKAQRELLHRKREGYKKYLEQILLDEQLTAERRGEIEKQLAETTKQINLEKAYDVRTAIGVVVEEYGQQQTNYAEYIKDIFNTVENAGVSLISATGTFTDKMKKFFDDITQSILVDMSKIIMKGLVMNAILSVFAPKINSSLGLQNAVMDYGMKYIGGGVKTNPYQINAPSFNFSVGNGHARGGSFSDGWSLVGEHGAELIRVGNSAQVYSSTDTNKLLNKDKPVNIKLDIHNESGTPVQAEKQDIKFDGESYILSVVLKGIANNAMGMRTIMKGAMG